MRFLFACGGTAGHINPAVAVAGKLRELMPDSKFLFVGAEGKMEMELVPIEGFEIKGIKITNLRRSLSPSGLVHNVKTLRNLASSRSRAEQIISEFQPDCVIGTGGYVCYPVLRTAAKMGIPTAVHEANAVPGLTTKMLQNHISVIMTGFEGCSSEYKVPKKVICTGTPVKSEFYTLTRDSARRELGIDSSRHLVVSFWGSLGASGMNSIMEQFIAQNYKSRAFDHIHATGGGEQGHSEFIRKLSQLGVGSLGRSGVDIRPYIFDMPKVMAAADLVLCRAGASTLSELIAMGKPSVLVPSPYVTNNHQEENAKVLEKAGGARLLTEQECTGEKLYNEVFGLLVNNKTLSDMAKALTSLKVSDATEKITEIILDLIKS